MLATPNQDGREFQQKKRLGSIKGSDIMSGRINSCYTFSSVIAREFCGILKILTFDTCVIIARYLNTLDSEKEIALLN